MNSKIAIIQSSLVWENSRKRIEKILQEIWIQLLLMLNLDSAPGNVSTGFTMSSSKYSQEEGKGPFKWMQQEGRREKKMWPLVGM